MDQRESKKRKRIEDHLLHAKIVKSFVKIITNGDRAFRQSCLDILKVNSVAELETKIEQYLKTFKRKDKLY